MNTATKLALTTGPEVAVGLNERDLEALIGALRGHTSTLSSALNHIGPSGQAIIRNDLVHVDHVAAVLRSALEVVRAS